MRQDIKQIKQELIKKGLKRFAYVKVDLGTPLSLLANEDNQHNERLLQNKKIKKYNNNFTSQDLHDLKGINYGSRELSFLHPAIMITNIKNKVPDNVMIVPMVSVSESSKKFKSSFHDFEIHKEYNNSLANPFLDNPSFLRLGELRTVGIERINIKETLKTDRSFKLLWHKDRTELINGLVKVITLKDDIEVV
ncbi:MAG: hypothetical protein U9Q33_07245 [Campylobacterota bacterium]|nr:hypothetical protein [Campylobacterota bacterium]